MIFLTMLRIKAFKLISLASPLLMRGILGKQRSATFGLALKLGFRQLRTGRPLLGPTVSASKTGRNPYLQRTRKVDISKIPKMSSENTSSASSTISKPIVWVDCEMTGLDHTKDKIIEICCIITDGDLNIVDEAGYESVVHCDKSILDGMDDWCVEHHGSSGLTQKVLESSKSTEQVEDELLAYVKRLIPDKRKGVLAGNSVHMDRIFMLREFPRVISHLFYRIIDVSSIMEVSFRHNPDLASVFPRKKGAHTARSDILESIAQLKWYREHYLKSAQETREFVERQRLQNEDGQIAESGSAKKSSNGSEGLTGVIKGIRESIAGVLKPQDEHHLDREESPSKKPKLDQE
ncbi:LADA_0C11430g1_1 [Lachancea dasiensis]|uniref:LADA_0C11430g1_1 n=1 Tax=Lachancea dasiensis TaxID=1072105 RepID=A0A1G4J1L4_9SACH|nr:LADA_0C11430g1_1 [Lachancea dasiensis]